MNKLQYAVKKLLAGADAFFVCFFEDIASRPFSLYTDARYEKELSYFKYVCMRPAGAHGLCQNCRSGGFGLTYASSGGTFLNASAHPFTYTPAYGQPFSFPYTGAHPQAAGSGGRKPPGRPGTAAAYGTGISANGGPVPHLRCNNQGGQG